MILTEQSAPDTSSPAAIPAPAAEDAPSVPLPVPDQAASAPSPVVEAAPVTAPAAPAEAPKAPVSALGTPPEAITDKPVTAPESPADGAKVEPPKEEASQSAETAPLPSYEAFTLPEGVTLEGERLGEFTKQLGEFQNRTKADQAEVQKFGQSLIDRHVAEVKDAVERVSKHNMDQWEKQKSDWKEAFEKDPEIGMNRKDTTIKNIVGELGRLNSPEQLAAFQDVMNVSGIGNHPATIRVMHNLVGEINRLRTAYESESGVKPLPGVKPQAEKKSRHQKFYGNMS